MPETMAPVSLNTHPQPLRLLHAALPSPCSGPWLTASHLKDLHLGKHLQGMNDPSHHSRSQASLMPSPVPAISRPDPAVLAISIKAEHPQLCSFVSSSPSVPWRPLTHRPEDFVPLHIGPRRCGPLSLSWARVSSSPSLSLGCPFLGGELLPGDGTSQLQR